MSQSITGLVPTGRGETNKSLIYSTQEGRTEFISSMTDTLKLSVHSVSSMKQMECMLCHVSYLISWAPSFMRNGRQCDYQIAALLDFDTPDSYFNEVLWN